MFLRNIELSNDYVAYTTEDHILFTPQTSCSYVLQIIFLSLIQTEWLIPGRNVLEKLTNVQII
jgi:hypothetical protein